MSAPIEIVSKPEMSFVGLRRQFIHALSPDSNGPTIIPALWGEFIPRLPEIGNRVGSATFGLVYAAPLADRAHTDELLYVAAAQVAAVENIPDGMVDWSVPESTYAVVTHRGAITDLPATLNHAYCTWLPSSDFEHAGTADVELYDDRFCPDSAESEMEYWIPVKS